MIVRTMIGAASIVAVLLAWGCGGASSPPPNEPILDPMEPREPAEATAEPVAEPEKPQVEPPPTVEAPPDEEMVDPGPPGRFTPSPGSGPLEVKVTVSPGGELTVAGAESFYLNISVKNPTRRLLRPDFANSQLMVNGLKLKYWKDTIAELPQRGVWIDLPPGRTVEFVFKVAEKVKVKPGEYVFVLKTGGSSSPSVRLHVRP